MDAELSRPDWLATVQSGRKQVQSRVCTPGFIHLVFQLDGYFLSQSAPVGCFHFIQATLTRLLVSLSAPPFESNIDPKYLNVVTVFSLSSSS